MCRVNKECPQCGKPLIEDIENPEYMLHPVYGELHSDSLCKYSEQLISKSLLKVDGVDCTLYRSMGDVWNIVPMNISDWAKLNKLDRKRVLIIESKKE